MMVSLVGMYSVPPTLIPSIVPDVSDEDEDPPEERKTRRDRTPRPAPMAIIIGSLLSPLSSNHAMCQHPPTAFTSSTFGAPPATTPEGRVPYVRTMSGTLYPIIGARKAAAV